MIRNTTETRILASGKAHLPEVRRIVTGHGRNGGSKIIWDKSTTNARQVKPGLVTTLVWSTDQLPVDISMGERIRDAGDARDIRQMPNGTQFVIVDFGPGTVDVWHRTETIDYVVVISGEIDMGLDDSTTRLKAGDVVIQRGTNHVWSNRGKSPTTCRGVGRCQAVGNRKTEIEPVSQQSVFRSDLFDNGIGDVSHPCGCNRSVPRSGRMHVVKKKESALRSFCAGGNQIYLRNYPLDPVPRCHKHSGHKLNSE